MLVSHMVLRSLNDVMIENAVYLFVNCKGNYSQWILSHYAEIRSPYAQSMMCLVLGFRADTEAIPFLMEQVDYMEKHWPNDSFSQGPLLALHEFRARFSAS